MLFHLSAVAAFRVVCEKKDLHCKTGKLSEDFRLLRLD